MLCGQEWYEKHKNDYTQEEIDALGIVVSVDERKLPEIKQGDKEGKVKKDVETLRFKK